MLPRCQWQLGVTQQHMFAKLASSLPLQDPNAQTEGFQAALTGAALQGNPLGLKPVGRGLRATLCKRSSAAAGQVGIATQTQQSS